MRALVCGGRKFLDKEFIWRTLDGFHSSRPIRFLFQGGANGADVIAISWAMARVIPCATMHANWLHYQRGAGPIRNGWMLEFLTPDVVIAFPGGSGTADMVDRAYKAGIEVKQFSI